MFERFTDRARRVVVVAQEFSRELRHQYIDETHLLLGLLTEDADGIAGQALAELGLTAEKVAGGEAIGDTVPVGHIPFTPSTKKTLELALREALQLGHNYIGTEHILLALARSGHRDLDSAEVKSVVRRRLVEAAEAAEAEKRHTPDPWEDTTQLAQALARTIKACEIGTTWKRMTLTFHVSCPELGVVVIDGLHMEETK